MFSHSNSDTKTKRHECYQQTLSTTIHHMHHHSARELRFRFSLAELLVQSKRNHWKVENLYNSLTSCIGFRNWFLDKLIIRFTCQHPCTWKTASEALVQSMLCLHFSTQAPLRLLYLNTNIIYIWKCFTNIQRTPARSVFLQLNLCFIFVTNIHVCAYDRRSKNSMQVQQIYIHLCSQF